MDPLTLFSSLVWSTFGLAFFMYGKKRSRTAPLVGGILLMAVSWIARTPLSLSIAGGAIAVGIWFASKRM